MALARLESRETESRVVTALEKAGINTSVIYPFELKDIQFASNRLDSRNGEGYVPGRASERYGFNGALAPIKYWGTVAGMIVAKRRIGAFFKSENRFPSRGDLRTTLGMQGFEEWHADHGRSLSAVFSMLGVGAEKAELKAVQAPIAKKELKSAARKEEAAKPMPAPKPKEPVAKAPNRPPPQLPASPVPHPVVLQPRASVGAMMEELVREEIAGKMKTGWKPSDGIEIAKGFDISPGIVFRIHRDLANGLPT